MAEIPNRSLVAILFIFLCHFLIGQDQFEIQNRIDSSFSTPILNAPSPDTMPVPEKKRDWNEFDLGFTTLRVGGGYIHDYVNTIQDDDSKAQTDELGVELKPDFKARDFRILINGVLNTKRYIQWKFAYMYDGDPGNWLIRETGLVIGLPELSSQVFLGRTKEGWSMPKIMNGHSPWTMERQMAVDLIPIIADGIRWYGYLPKSGFQWTLAAWNDFLSHEQKFSTFEQQYLARLGWMKYINKEQNHLLHIAGYYRYGVPEDGKFRARSRPESNPTPYFVDTGEFLADQSNHFGGELYYSQGRFMIGTEWYVHNFSSSTSEDHSFPGGDAMVSYFFSKPGMRPYNTTGNIYGFVQVPNAVGKGGFGLWEGVLRLSTFDLTDGSIQGGKIWRITPMLNWYATKVIRMEFVYGYAVMDRFSLKGGTQFFQSRIQFTIF